MQGAFERTIAIYRTANAHIVQARATQLGNAQGAILYAVHCLLYNIYVIRFMVLEVIGGERYDI